MHDSQVANDLIEVIQEAQYFIADKGYDSQEIRDKAIEHGMKAIIPKRKNAKQPNPDFDSYLYKLRHLVENAFARLKQFRSIATRYEKLARNFKSMLYLACSIIHAKLNWGHALITWSDTFNRVIRRFESFFLVGFVQTGLGVFVGTPGPLNIAMLNKYYDDNNVVVTTGALMMTVVHTAKLLVYVAMGFVFADYWQLLVMMVVMATVGSWLGTRLRHKIRLDWLEKILPYLLTLIALKLIVDIAHRYFFWT